MLADSDYVQWLSELKKRYRQSQAKAAVHVNHGMLEFYWSLGKDIVALKAESKWGSNVLQQLSADLKEAFPKQTGFSYTNIKYMRQWYSFYYEQITNRQQPVGDLYLPEHKNDTIEANTSDLYMKALLHLGKHLSNQDLTVLSRHFPMLV